MRTFFAWAVLSVLAAGCATTAKTDYDPVTQDLTSIDKAHPPAMIELNLDSHGERLNGILYQANGAGPHPSVVMLHGYPGNEKNLDVAQALRRAGLNVLFFHYRGAWASGGDFSFSHVIEDVASAIDMLRARAKEYRVDAKRIALIGHSMGGFAALQGAARDDNIQCVAGIAAADYGQAFQNRGATERIAASTKNLPMLAGWTPETATEDLTRNADEFSVRGLAPKLAGKSLLLIAGTRDSVLPPNIFHDPLVAAYQREPGITLEHGTIPGDHSFSDSRIALTRTLITWARKCMAT